jgi:glutamyl-tRNA synthetase
MDRRIRVRFAPSPTGGLHLGGVRTVLYNYLFARQMAGDLILRIEDTDQNRYVAGAESYLIECLNWCGLNPDEGPHIGGAYGPYRQSERNALGIYKEYAEQLLRSGKAYYAFDLPEELESMRNRYKTPENPSPQYDHTLRMQMRNSLSLTLEETERLLESGVPYVIRILMPENETVSFTDMIRGEVHFNTALIDDKILVKADGMPTYHLAVVVDDYLMKITHVFRGEEWLSSAPVHILLWKYLFGVEYMPGWAHLPLILKPDGNGKLSKRDGDRLGFPVFAMNWTDPKTGELTIGFRERGFLQEAFINMLAVLGWNDGTEQELFTMEELVEKFSMDRVHKGGARFNYEKARWFNQEWLKKLPIGIYQEAVKKLFEAKGIQITDDDRFARILDMVKDRCTLLPDFVDQAAFFFKLPEQIDLAAIEPKWNPAKNQFFAELIRAYGLISFWQKDDLEKEFKEIAAAHQIKAGEVLLPFRIMLVGGKFGPGVFDIAAILERAETIRRIKLILQMLHK